MKLKHNLGILHDSDPTSSLRGHPDRPSPPFFFTLVPAVLPDNTRRAPGFEKKCLRISMTQTHPAMCQGKMLTRKTLYALSIDANDT